MAVGTSSAFDGAKESKRKKVDNEEKKKFKSSQYNCTVFCLDGSEIAADVDVCFFVLLNFFILKIRQKKVKNIFAVVLLLVLTFLNCSKVNFLTSTLSLDIFALKNQLFV